MIDLGAAHERQQVFAALKARQFRDAFDLSMQLLRTKKKDTELLRAHAVAAMHLGRFDQAIKTFEKYLALKPNDLVAATDLGCACVWHGKASEGRAQFDRVLAASPGFPPAILGLADLHERGGDDAAVERVLRPIIDAQNETAQMAVVYARLLLRTGRAEEAAAIAEKHLANDALDVSTRQSLLEKSAKAFEKLGDYKKAFEAFSASNLLRSEPFDPDAFVAHYDQLISYFAASNMAKLPRSRYRSDLPIFIACMPRTGSTLIEQIIHAHPKAFGAGEIPDFQDMIFQLPNTLSSMWPYPGCLGDFRQQHADALSKKYLDALRQYDRRATRIVNKHLDNARCLGMVELLAPDARVIHIRRDPLDTCFSCFMAQIATNKFHWATDLRNIALAYKQFERIMAHWHEVLTIPMLVVQYEDLVEDTETWSRKIIEFCGLPWDDKCLRFWEADRAVLTLSYDQVRQPIYKSSMKRYEKYEQFLGPLKEALASEGAG